MTKHMRFQMIAIALVMTLVAAACGGGADDTANANGENQPGVAFDAEDTGAEVAAIPTTAPLVVEDSTTSTDATEPLPTEAPSLLAEVEDPNEVTVLHVNDDVGIVPTFDGPNGNEVTLVDVNPIDNVDTQYPLLAQTVFGNRLALLVDEFDASGNWAKVHVPVRPNGSTAWVQTAFFRQESHDYRIEISVSQNKVNVFKGDQLLVEQISVMGRESRPTPVVRSYIDEKIRGETLSPAYGDWVLSIAAYSEALGTFGGGLPKLALHGTNQPELMGQYVSSGCIRIPNEVVSFIAETVPVGTVVDIVA